jgi:hypothetical protein
MIHFKNLKLKYPRVKPEVFANAEKLVVLGGFNGSISSNKQLPQDYVF